MWSSLQKAVDGTTSLHKRIGSIFVRIDCFLSTKIYMQLFILRGATRGLDCEIGPKFIWHQCEEEQRVVRVMACLPPTTVP